MTGKSGKTIISLVLTIGLLTGASLVCAGTNSTAAGTTTAVQKEKVPKPMMAGKKKGCKCRMGMMSGKDKTPKGMMGCRGMMGGMPMKRMSDEQRQKFLDETAPLRRQMVGKRFDFMEALRNPKTTAEDLAKIEKGMLELRIKMLDKLIGASKK